jgi:hypothetical protein
VFGRRETDGDAQRGGEVLRELMERGLVRIAGRDDSLGRPVLCVPLRLPWEELLR